jgi:hypothetical protein
MTQYRNGQPVGADGLTRDERWNRAKRERRAQARGETPDFVVYEPPSPDLTALQIIARMKEDFDLKRENEEGRKLIETDINITGPIGIIHFGDPHLDDGGTDWFALERDMALVKSTPGLFAGNIGDTTNNWVGRLAQLYGCQTTTARQAWTLAEYFIKDLAGHWLYHISGNHDEWSGDGNPLRWICKDVGALLEQSEARLGINFPNGRQVVINARHDFAGSSQWNPTHGPMKAAQLGTRDDIMICGHKHKSGYSPLKDPESGKVLHCIQVASYKIYDRYAREKGFRDQSLSPCVVTVIDPDADNPANLIQVFWDSTRGAEYLTYLRSKKGL